MNGCWFVALVVHGTNALCSSLFCGIIDSAYEVYVCSYEVYVASLSLFFFFKKKKKVNSYDFCTKS